MIPTPIRHAAPRHARTPAYGPARAVYLPRLADAVASSMATYTVPLLVLGTTDSSSLTGVAFVLAWGPRLCTFGLAGSAVDRLGAGRVFRMAACARAVVVGLAAPVLLLVGDTAAAVVVMLLAACTGFLTEFSYIAAESVGAVASREAAGGAHRVQSVLLGIDQAAALIGPAAGGVLLQWGGSSGMLAAISGLSILSAVITPHIRQPVPEATPSLLRGLRSGWSTLRALPMLAYLVAGLALSNLALGVLQAATPVVLMKQLGQSSASVGLVWSAAAAASLLAVAGARIAIDRWGLVRTGRVASLITVAPCFALAHADSYPAYLLLIAVFMAGDSALAVVLRTLRSSLIPAEVFGSTLSLTVLILLLPFPLAGVVMAAVAPADLDAVITACAVLQCLGLALAFVRAGRLRPSRGKHRRAARR
ncbi:MFS transporter [Streptomyces glaucus]|uniref:MFS transporter n=1 Tax=Streptomyces glaucus TaxID=284029 RepID=A0ABN3JTX8_9ACTN